MVGAISYPHYRVIPVTKGPDFTLCKQPDTDQLVYVKNEYLLQTETGVTAKSDVSCAQISVREGSMIELVDGSCSGYNLLKQAGLVEWIAKDRV